MYVYNVLLFDSTLWEDDILAWRFQDPRWPPWWQSHRTKNVDFVQTFVLNTINWWCWRPVAAILNYNEATRMASRHPAKMSFKHQELS